MYGSSYVTAKYLKEKYPEIKKVRVVGMEGINKEMNEVGIESTGGTSEIGKKMDPSIFDAQEIDPTVSAVVVGLDYGFNYYKMCLASLYLQTGNVRFIATNYDAYDYLEDGVRLPGAAVMIESIALSLKATKVTEKIEPEVVGKPNPYVIDLIELNCNDIKMFHITGRDLISWQVDWCDSTH